MLQTLIKKFEEENDCKVVYLTKSGSTLYGTNTPASDVDYRGVYIPNKRDVLLKRDLPLYSYSTGGKDSKNTKDDIDFHLDSIHTWFKLLKKGETGSLDLLFSMFREDTIVLQDTVFLNLIKDNYKSFYGKNLQAFVGYCVGQARQSGIKGTRYGELKSFLKVLNSDKYIQGALDQRLDALLLPSDVKKFKYINFVMAPGPRSNRKQEDILYLDVLGKKYALHSTSLARLIEKLTEMEASYGSRAKEVTEGICYKSLGHSLRVILEVKELLETNFIKFPLSQRQYILDIRAGKVDETVILNTIEHLIEEVDSLLETTDIQESSDTEKVDEIYLHLLDLKEK